MPLQHIDGRAKAVVGSIAGLDILRFGAALLVALYHLGSADWIVRTSDGGQALGGRAAYPEAYPYSWFGFVGVEIFFVISGVVIAYSALKQDAWRFAQHRVLRLFPAAWVCASITVAVSAVLGLYDWKNLAHRWIATAVLSPIEPWADSVYWTLGIEMVFYASIFVLLLTARKRLYAFGLLIGLASSAYWLGGAVFFPAFLKTHLWSRALELSLLPYGIYFGLGVVLFMRRERFRWFDLAFGVCALLASSVEISLKTAANLAEFGRSGPTFLPVALFLAAFVFIELSFRLSAGRRTANLFRTLGIATYPFYLLHNVVGAATIHWLVDLGVSRWVALAAALGLIAGLSIAISRLAEPKIRAGLGGMLSAGGRAFVRWLPSSGVARDGAG